MTTPDVAPDVADRLHAWFRDHDDRLYRESVEAFDDNGSLRGALKKDERGRTAVSVSQLHALENTARMCPPQEFILFVAQRATRRAASGKDVEAAFWKGLEHLLRGQRDAAVTAALESEALAGVPSNSPVRHLAQGLAGRALAGHLAAHARYLAQGGEVARLNPDL